MCARCKQEKKKMPKPMRRHKSKDRAPLPGVTLFFSDREARARIMREIEKNPAPPGVDPVLWFTHFSGLPEGEKATCEDCADFNTGICEGGGDPVDCFSTETADFYAREYAKKRRL